MSIKKVLFALLAGAVLAAPALPAFAAATFFWRYESTTLDSTHDKSASDTTADAVASPSLASAASKYGTNGFTNGGAGSTFYRYDTSVSSIVTTASGQIAVWVKWVNTVPTSGVSGPIELHNSGATLDEISINPASSQEFLFRIRKDGGSNCVITTTAVNATAGTWYFVLARWHIANDDRKLEVYTESGGVLTLVDSIEDLSTDLSGCEPATIDRIDTGATGSFADTVYADNLLISQSYTDVLSDFATITSYKPTYTTGPSDGTFTPTTLPFSYTPDQKGTTYAAACTNGQTITTFANLKSGTCSGGAAIGTGTDTANAGAANTVTITGLTASTTYDVYIGHESDIGGQSSISSLADRTTTSAGSPDFDTAPSVSSQTTNAYTISYDANGSAANIYVGAYYKNSAAPTCDNLRLGTGTGFKNNATEATTGSADSITLSITGGDPFPVYDLYGCVRSGGGTNSAVTAMTNEVLDTPSGRIYMLRSGSPAADQLGLFDTNAPAIANNDWMDVQQYADSADNGPAVNLVTLNADTTFEIDTATTQDFSRQKITRRFYDVSLQAWSDATAVAYYVNNKPPTWVGWDAGGVPFLFEKDATCSKDLGSLWVDPEGDTMTLDINGVPPGGSVTTNVLDCSFSAYGYYQSPQFTAQDIAGDSAAQVQQIVVGLRVPSID